MFKYAVSFYYKFRGALHAMLLTLLDFAMIAALAKVLTAFTGWPLSVFGTAIGLFLLRYFVVSVAWEIRKQTYSHDSLYEHRDELDPNDDSGFGFKLHKDEAPSTTNSS